MKTAILIPCYNESATIKKVVCDFDEFSENNQLNQIIKAAIISLLHGDVSKERKTKLKSHLFFFNNGLY